MANRLLTSPTRRGIVIGVATLLGAAVLAPVPHAAADPAETPPEILAGWQLKYSEDFDNLADFSTDTSPWIRFTGDDPFDTIMDDYGDWWKNDYGPAFDAAVNSYATYRKDVQLGTDGWLTATLSGRDWTSSGAPQRAPTISTVRTDAGNALKINSPDSYDGAMITTTDKLPPQYRLEYHLKTIDFGGERNGSIYYDGKENGYTQVDGVCKSQFPYAEGVGTPGWNSEITTNPCDWQSVTDGPYGYNAFHMLGIVDFAHPEPANLHFWHYKRKVLMDVFSQHPDRVGTGSGGRVCDPETNTYYTYRDSTKNVVDMWINGLPNFRPGRGGITGNGQYFMTTCSGGAASNQVSPSAAAEMVPELMPGSDYIYAIERDQTGYTLEVTGTFLRGGYRTIRFHRNFIVDNVPIWHYNNTPDQYDGHYNNTLHQNGVYAQQDWPNQWPAGSGYPDFPVIGDPYTDAGEGSATIDSVKLYVPATTPAWDASTVYNTGDKVTYNNTSWEAAWWTRNQAPGDPTGPWQEIAVAGDGTAVWTPSRIFNAGDVARYNGKDYSALWWTRNQEPGTPNGAWSLVGGWRNPPLTFKGRLDPGRGGPPRMPSDLARLVSATRPPIAPEESLAAAVRPLPVIEQVVGGVSMASASVALFIPTIGAP